MVEILKSKVLVGFMVFMVGIIYFNSCSLDSKNILEDQLDSNVVVLNEK